MNAASDKYYPRNLRLDFSRMTQDVKDVIWTSLMTVFIADVHGDVTFRRNMNKHMLVLEFIAIDSTGDGVAFVYLEHQFLNSTLNGCFTPNRVKSRYDIRAEVDFRKVDRLFEMFYGAVGNLMLDDMEYGERKTLEPGSIVQAQLTDLEAFIVSELTRTIIVEETSRNFTNDLLNRMQGKGES